MIGKLAGRWATQIVVPYVALCPFVGRGALDPGRDGSRSIALTLTMLMLAVVHEREAETMVEEGTMK